eukprot:TRINITY_DN30441_c0_g1_i1.p1 TRINITY_DN30441_c0_g1~~TRINITY_DN30441_c0_g1_i1.p1  ORF type:complete len:191 (+),score=57.73 TRINITY_DN30441_c0_g1_i1:86-658(+)
MQPEGDTAAAVCRACEAEARSVIEKIRAGLPPGSLRTHVARVRELAREVESTNPRRAERIRESVALAVKQGSEARGPAARRGELLSVPPAAERRGRKGGVASLRKGVSVLRATHDRSAQGSRTLAASSEALGAVERELGKYDSALDSAKSAVDALLANQLTDNRLLAASFAWFSAVCCYVTLSRFGLLPF